MTRNFYVLACWIVSAVMLALVAIEITGPVEKGIELVPAAIFLFVLGWIIDHFPQP